MPKVEFKRVETDEEVENINIKDGQLIYSKTGKTFMDYGNERIPTGSGGSSVDVDTEMSDISENAVQNKVIKEYVDNEIEDVKDLIPNLSNEYGTSDSNGYTQQYINGLVNIIYPVGSIYMSVNNTNPSTLFGGTWQQLEDRFLLGAGTTYTAGNTGGNMVELMNSLGVTADQFGGIVSGGNYAKRMVGTIATITNEQSFMMPLSGFGFDGLPPYLVVYMWKRTA